MHTRKVQLVRDYLVPCRGISVLVGVLTRLHFALNQDHSAFGKIPCDEFRGSSPCDNIKEIRFLLFALDLIQYANKNAPPAQPSSEPLPDFAAADNDEYPF